MAVPFVTFGGSQLLLEPPYFAENVSLYAFLIEADAAALQRLLDQRLNNPFGAEQRFVPEGSLVMVVFNKIGKMYSQNSPDREKGWFSEQEAAIWVRVADTRLEKSFWFHPYMFVDNSYAMALGREVYGFPKAAGWFEIPEMPQGATRFSLETLVLPVFNPNTQGVRLPLIEVERTAQFAIPDLETAVDFLSGIIGLETPQGNALDKVRLIVNSIGALSHLDVPMVFLKQFPTADQPGFACLQTVIEATAVVAKVHNVEYVPGKWQVSIAQAASHPIVQDLGLTSNVVEAKFQFWAKFDMLVGLGSEVASARDLGRPKKIAILGGGVGAMATALELTREPGWQSRYDVTIYQKGWRLGGKGASGRGECDRIEEHGLHIWLGFYENAFRIMRQVYEENKANRKPGTPLRECFEAFEKHSFVALMDQEGRKVAAEWTVWPVHAPEFPGTPGDGVPLTWSDTFARLWGWLEELFRDSTFHKNGSHPVPESGFWGHLTSSFKHLIPGLDLGNFDLAAQVFAIGEIARNMRTDAKLNQPEHHKKLSSLTGHFRDSFRQKMRPHLASKDVESRRLYEVFELATAITLGLLDCGYLLDHSKLDTLTDEFQDWLKTQGADPIASDLDESCVLRGLYDLVFAYKNGEAAKPSFEAGVAIRSMLLMTGSYKGAIFWKMQAGMGDVVFAPMFEVLRSRGVKFEFFHRVEKLGLNQENNAITSVEMGIQATLRDPENGYQPLILAKDLPCWPAQPCFDQLVQGEEIRQGGYNLESFWTTWTGPGSKTLRVGQDFDQLVLAISIGGIPYLFDDLTRVPERFRLMLDKVETVRTQSMQLWANDSLDALGWEGGSVVLDAFTNPINTWAVMDQLLVRENWPDDSVKSIHYFCGQMEGDIPPRIESHTPEVALGEVEKACDDFAKETLPLLLPNLTKQKVVSRFLRANIDPSERYVQSTAGSTRYRLKANESGISNLILAGDWTKNGFNAGCVEAAVMSGIQAANALAGRPLDEGIDGPLAS